MRHTAAGATVTATGSIDIVTAPALWVTLDDTRRELRTTSPGSALLVDLREVAFLSAAGLSTLLAVHSCCGADGTGMRVIADQPAVLRPLTVTGLRWLLAAPLTTDGRHRPCT